MGASYNGHLEVVRTLVEGKTDINAQDKVRNQMMIIIIILINIIMMMNGDVDDNNSINYHDVDKWY